MFWKGSSHKREFVRAYTTAVESKDLDQRFAAATRALELIPLLDPWPMPKPARNSAIGTMHGVRARVWSERHEAGDIEAGARGIAEYQDAVKHYSSDHGVNGVVLELNHAIALDTLRTGDRVANRARAEEIMRNLLDKLTPDQDLGTWANIRLNLISMYGEPDWPDVASRVEKGVDLASEIIQHTSPRTFPVLWVRGKISMAILLLERTRGIRPANIEEAIGHLEDAKRVVPPDDPSDFPYLLEIFSRAFAAQSEFNSPESLERALEFNAGALKAFDDHGHRVRWAHLKVQRALLLSRQKGEQHANSRAEARKSLEDALTVFTVRAFPDEHVRARGLLDHIAVGQEPIGGEHSNHGSYESALERLEQEDREKDPYSWQQAHQWVGYAIQNQRGVISAADADEAIEHFELALSVLDPKQYPRDWCAVMQGLADIWAGHSGHDLESNVERAVQIQEEVIERVDVERNPMLWAESARRLALNYSERVRGRQADNIELGIAYLEQALAVIDDERESDLACLLLEDLSWLFANRIRGDAYRNARRSLDLIREADKSHDRTRDPVGWLRVGNKVRDAMKRVADLEENNEQSNNGLTSGGQVAPARIDRSTDPYEFLTRLEHESQSISPDAHFRTWALARLAYADALSWVVTEKAEAKGEFLLKKLEQLDRAIEVCRGVRDEPNAEHDPYIRSRAQGRIGSHVRMAALLADGAHRFFDVPEEPLRLEQRRRMVVEECERSFHLAQRFGSRSVLSNATTLGDAYSDAEQWGDALNTYAEAMHASAEIVGDPEVSEGEARATIGMLGKIASSAPWAAIQLGDLPGAIRWAAQTRSRLLTKALSRGEIVPNDQLTEQVTSLGKKVLELEDRIAGPELMNRLPVLRELIDSRADLARLLRMHRGEQFDHTIGSASHWLEGVVKDVGWMALLVLTSSGGKWVVAGPADSGVRIDVFDTPHDMDFERFMSGDRGKDASAWTDAYACWTSPHSKIAEFKWRQFLPGACQQLFELYTGRLWHAADELNLPEGATIKIIPHSSFAMLPIAASGPANSPDCLIDRFAVSVLPSILTHKQATATDAPDSIPRSAAIIFAPTDGAPEVALPSAVIEAALAASAFDVESSVVEVSDSLDLERAVSALRGRDIWHFATHGVHDPEDQLKSGLVLSEKSRLTLRDLFMRFDLGKPRLVVLGACESGLYGDGGLPAELIGLPTSFLMLGAESVIAALWPVSDLSTTLLMGKLYEEYPAQTNSSSQGLRRALLWLRDSTLDVILDSIHAWRDQSRLEAEQCDWLEEMLSSNLENRPFKSKDHWGAWVHYGTG